MKNSTPRSRRHRNPKNNKKEQQPAFFPKANDVKVQTKEESSFFQPKLEISPANDPQEKEADAVANNVVHGVKQQAAAGVQKKEQVSRMAEQEEKPKAKLQRMAEEEKADAKLQRMAEEEQADAKLQRAEMEEEAAPKLQRMGKEEEAAPKLQRMAREEEARPKLQRMAEEEQADAKLQKMEEKEEAAPKLQARTEGVEQKVATKRKKKEASDSLEQMIKASKGKGFALPFDIRTEMEAQFNVDFSEVRIHNDSEAIEMCEKIRAQAFAHGFHIYFNAGKYNPDTDTGKNLLAHELTHVVQQKGS